MKTEFEVSTFKKVAARFEIEVQREDDKSDAELLAILKTQELDPKLAAEIEGLAVVSSTFGWATFQGDAPTGTVEAVIVWQGKV